MALNNSNDFSCSTWVGYVEDYDAKTHMAKVFIPEKNFTTSFLPLVIPNSFSNKDELHLDKSEHVVCLLLGSGLETGFILGSFYDDTNKPPVANQNIRSVTFEDGTLIQYDRENHKLEINCVGDIEITASKNIRLTAQRIDLN